MANNRTPTVVIEAKTQEVVDEIKKQMISRGVRATNELINAKNLTLKGKRSGRRYRVPSTGGYYIASAPGEVPANRTNQYRREWDEKSFADKSGSGMTVHATIESRVRTDGGKYLLGDLLENGSPNGKIAPRPHQDKIIEKAKPKIRKIYKEPYT